MDIAYIAYFFSIQKIRIQFIFKLYDLISK